MQLEIKLLQGFERLAEVLKSLLWEKAKKYGISPIQIQILIFVSKHKSDICNVSYLAREFSITKATVSDAVRVLLKKGLVEKDFSPIDNRRYNLLLTPLGEQLEKDLSEYNLSIKEELSQIEEPELQALYNTLTKLVIQLNERNIIQVQRTCFNCQYYKGNRNEKHFCKFIERDLQQHELRLDCGDFEERVDKL